MTLIPKAIRRGIRTLPQVLATFQNTLTELDVLIAAHSERVTNIRLQVSELDAERADLMNEIDHVKIVRTNIEALIKG